jgi:hypothetical protein
MSEKVYSCSLCGKGFPKQGHLNLHMYHCKMKNPSPEGKQPIKKVEDQVILETCNHNFRLLNLHVPIERKAYQAGYKEVCSKCQDLQ